MTGSTSLRIEAAVSDSVATITLTGDVDISNSASVTAALDAQAPPIRRIVVDLRGVSFMDSMGLGALIDGRNRLALDGIEVVLVTGNGPVARLLELTKLTGSFMIFDSVETATSAW